MHMKCIFVLFIACVAASISQCHSGLLCVEEFVVLASVRITNFTIFAAVILYIFLRGKKTITYCGIDLIFNFVSREYCSGMGN